METKLKTLVYYLLEKEELTENINDLILLYYMEDDISLYICGEVKYWVLTNDEVWNETDLRLRIACNNIEEKFKKFVENEFSFNINASKVLSRINLAEEISSQFNFENEFNVTKVYDDYYNIYKLNDQIRGL